MNISQAHQLRKVLGWITAGLLCAALLSLADALTAGFKNGTREFQATPGTVIPISAPLPPGAEKIEDMRIHGGGEGVTMVPEGLFSGFWLGGNMWKGSIKVELDAKPGKRTFSLEGPPDVDAVRPPQPLAFQVTIYRNARAQRQASASFLTRELEVNPFAASLFCLLLAVPGGGAVFLLSRRIERLLTLEGIALVYMVKETEEGPVIAFSLGSDQGIYPGKRVRIMGPDGRTVGEAQVTASTSGDATARIVSGSCDMGCMVVLSSGEAPPAQG